MLGRQCSEYSPPSTTQRSAFHAGAAQMRFRSARLRRVRTLAARGEARRHAQHRHRRGGSMRQHLPRIPQQVQHAVVVMMVAVVRIVLVVRLMPVEETGAAAAMTVRQQAAVCLCAMRPRALREGAGNHHRHQQQHQHQHAISQYRLHDWYSSSPTTRGQVSLCASARQVPPPAD